MRLFAVSVFIHNNVTWFEQFRSDITSGAPCKCAIEGRIVLIDSQPHNPEVGHLKLVEPSRPDTATSHVSQARRGYVGAPCSEVLGQEWGWQWIQVELLEAQGIGAVREEQRLCALELAMSGARASGSAATAAYRTLSGSRLRLRDGMRDNQRMSMRIHLE